MISRTATRTKISPLRQGRSNPDSRKTSAIDHAVRVVHSVCCLAGAASLIDDIRADLRAEGIPSAIRRHDSATLFDWLISALSYQGISDQVAADYMERHGRPRWADIDAKVAAGPTCPKLKTYWHFHDCRYDKISRTCSEPDHIDACPLPSHQLRNGRLNQMAYSLFLFVRDIADGDLVGWIDRQFQSADDPASPNRLARTAGSRDWTAAGGLWRLGQGSDHDLVMHPVGRPSAPAPLARGRRQHDCHRHPGA